MIGNKKIDKKNSKVKKKIITIIIKEIKMLLSEVFNEKYEFEEYQLLIS